MNLEYGKRYVTRNGKATTALQKINSDVFPYHCPAMRYSWTCQGFFSGSGLRHDLDIVREYVEQETKPSNEELTLRDYLASQERIYESEGFGWPLLEALAGRRPIGTWDSNPLEWFDWSNRWQAVVKYARADAMIAARKGGTNE